MSEPISGEGLLFLTDEQLQQGIEGMFFAYRGFTADPDRILEELNRDRDQNYGRAHHRAVHFVARAPGSTARWKTSLRCPKRLRPNSAKRLKRN